MFQLTEREFLPVSFINSWAYCPYKLFLQEIQKVKPSFSRHLVEGSKQHGQLLQEFLKEAIPMEDSLEVQLEKVQKNEIKPFAIREFSIQNAELKLRGRIDEIQFFSDKILVVDNKKTPQFHPSDYLQIQTYSLLFQKKFNPTQEIWMGLQHSSSGKFYFSESFQPIHVENVRRTVGELHDLFDGKKEFKPTPTLSKCAECSVKRACVHAME